ncbi:NADPH:quinone oxidoreductase family protein [Portibacter lacus]|uniref:NADPH:quinone oxidoreductase n=1 Tax=Portibacter lacus TaxID=1099794 RepID=A0AA37SV69_9BACT|nr:NADPH:quinone oxidoreductase family protein [Portibacter lacus]GLR18753.1 NADPH:quinone oxidoreductase [Portibacter lacus]
MKAIVCSSFGPPSNLEFKDVPDPIPADDEILIKVHACGINFPDTLIIQGLYQFKPEFPFSPSGDIAGVVEAVGSAVKHLKVGDTVIAMTTYGGMAEKAVAKASVTFPKPPGMPMVNAASFMIAYGTSYHALVDRAELKEGETLLVLGASGGVGLSAVEIGKHLGAHVIAAASTAEKLALCEKHGADEFINYTEVNLKEKVKELTNGKGVDVIYDPVGGDFSEQALRAIAWKGRHLVVGFAAGSIPKIPLNLALLKGCSIVGVFWGSFAQRNPKKNMQNTMDLLQLFTKGILKPHIHKIYSLEEGPQALVDMMERKVKGKAVVSIV